MNRTKTWNAAGFVMATIALAAAPTSGQGNLTLTVNAQALSLSMPSSTACGASTVNGITNLVRTEPIDVTLTTVPFVPSPPPGTLFPRRLILALGIEACPPTALAGIGNVFFNTTGALPIVFIFDSFSNPFAPVFGPPLQGANNTLQVTLGLDLFSPTFALPLPPLILQALCEDTPGSATPLLLSNPVRMQLVDPAGPFPTTLGSKSPGSGPEAGSTIATPVTLTLTGTNFLPQTNWVTFQPTVTFTELTPPEGMAAVVHPAFTFISSNTQATFALPAIPLSVPPATHAGFYSVKYRTSTSIAPSAVEVTCPTNFLYLSGLTPTINALVPGTTSPHGGVPLAINGSGFLHGAMVTLTSATNPALTTTVFPPNASFGPGGTTINITAPAFCTGSVNVQVTNVDLAASNVAVLPVFELAPAIATIAPTFNVVGLGGPASFPAISDAGSVVNIAGSNFVEPTSGIVVASQQPPPGTVPNDPNMVFATRVEISGPGFSVPLAQPNLSVTSPATITGPHSVPNQAGDFRPLIGVRTLTVINPPCVHAGNASPITTAAPILIQDESPPAIAAGGVFPDVIASPGGAHITITGANFFRTTPALTQVFAQAPAPVLSSLVVPAVSINGQFSPLVTFTSSGVIDAVLPTGLATGVATIVVFNPDGRSVTNSTLLRIVPPLTNPTARVPQLQFLPPGAAVLDTTTLGVIAQPTNVSPFAQDLSILFLPNPAKTLDQQRDAASGGPALPLAAYDGMFLFNTRMADGTIRFFDFDRIVVPSTINLAQAISIPVAGGSVTISAGTKRVIFKAGSFGLDAVGVFQFFVDQNHPLILRSHDDFQFDGLANLSGDSLINVEALLVTTLKFQVRCEWQLQPAGSGLGGRAGLHYTNDLHHFNNVATGPLILPALPSSMPPGNLGASAVVLTGVTGFFPSTRSPVASGTEPPTGGAGGTGRSPIGQQAGAGGGGGYTTAGANGQPGSTTASPGGVAYGNATNNGGITGHPSDNRNIYGAVQADFITRLGSTNPTVFPSGLFYGGSGGGGGGGSLALFVPCISVGGRGGNGGGGIVMLSDRVFTLGPNGRIWTDGETGYLGLDAFPIANQDPLFVLCAPGSGGGGSGGSIFIAAVSDADLSGSAAQLPNRKIISADAGPAGVPIGSVITPTANGGIGSVGRVRVAMNQFSSRAAQRQAELLTRYTSGHVIPPPPMTPALPPFFFTYPSP